MKRAGAFEIGVRWSEFDPAAQMIESKGGSPESIIPDFLVDNERIRTAYLLNTDFVPARLVKVGEVHLIDIGQVEIPLVGVFVLFCCGF